MPPHLGLVCITDCDIIRYRAMTRKRYAQFEEQGSGVLQKALQDLYADNLLRFNRAVTYCKEHEIRLYRVTSHLFPFADTPFGREVLSGLEDELRAAGRRATAEGIRVVIHPDQFVVLSSDTPRVVENSMLILETHALVFDLLEQPRSSWAAINIHGGKGNRAERLIEVTRSLPEGVRSRITFENDEYAYSADEILEVCRAAEVPMIFDAHHHLVNEGLESYEDSSFADYVEAARETWPDPDWQIVHISNGRERLADPRHSDVIDVMPSSFRRVPWIEVEAKGKELAIEKLRSEWLSGIIVAGDAQEALR